MIDLLQAPQQDAILWDANNTIIKVKSYRHDIAYFKVLISVDNVLFTTQNWSKNSDGESQQDLQQLYYNYFKHSFTPIASGAATITSLNSSLKKKISITVQECFIGTDTVIDFIELPEYYIHFNERPVDYDLSDSFILLSTSNLTAPVDGKIRISTYTNDDVILSIIDDQNVTNLAAYTLSVNEPGINYIDVDLNSLSTPISSNATALTINLTVSNVTLPVKITLSRKRLFKTKQVYYRDDYGVYLAAYLFGQETLESELDQESYLDNNLSPVTYYVEDLEIIEIASGNDYLPLTSIMHAISRSIDIKLYLDSNWTSIHCTTNKVMRFIERQYVYQEVLTFERNSFRHIENMDYIPIPSIQDMTFTQDEGTNVDIYPAQLTVAANGFDYDRVRITSFSQYGRHGAVTPSQTFLGIGSRIPREYLINDIDFLLYVPNYGLNGMPLEILSYQLGNGTIWSHPASIILNYIDLSPGNRAPFIDVYDQFIMPLDSSGNGQRAISVTITDPDGDAYNVLWEALNGAPITFQSTTSESNEIIITGGTELTQYQVKITATDTLGHSSSKIIYVNTIINVVYITGSRNAIESTDTVTVYDMVINGLPLGDSIDVVAEAATTSQQQAYRINYLNSTEKIVSSYNRILRESYVNINGGDVNFQIALDNISGNNDTKLYLKLDNPSEDVFIDDQRDVITLEPEKL